MEEWRDRYYNAGFEDGGGTSCVHELEDVILFKWQYSPYVFKFNAIPINIPTAFFAER